MKDQRHIQYDLNDYGFRPGEELKIARIEASIAFNFSDKSSAPEPSMNVRYFNATVCPAAVFVQFNVNQFTRKKPVSGQISLWHDLGKCKTNLEIGHKNKLEASMYVLNTDVTKAQEIVKAQMLEKVKDLASVIKNVSAGIRELSKDSQNDTPEP